MLTPAVLPTVQSERRRMLSQRALYCLCRRSLISGCAPDHTRKAGTVTRRYAEGCVCDFSEVDSGDHDYLQQLYLRSPTIRAGGGDPDESLRSSTELAFPSHAEIRHALRILQPHPSRLIGQREEARPRPRRGKTPQARVGPRPASGPVQQSPGNGAAARVHLARRSALRLTGAAASAPSCGLWTAHGPHLCCCLLLWDDRSLGGLAAVLIERTWLSSTPVAGLCRAGHDGRGLGGDRADEPTLPPRRRTPPFRACLS